MRAILAFLVLLLPIAALAGEPAQPPAAAAPAPQCTLLMRATLDMAMDETGRITVPVTVNGTAKEMMVDTGAPSSLITADTVGELKLKFGFAASGRYIMGFGGSLAIFVAHIDELGFGKVKARNFNLYVEPDHMSSAGLLGADFLTKFDIDLDFARAQLNMITSENCAGNVVYWSQKPYGVIPFDIEDNHIMVKVQLDGQDIRAGLDTGAVDTLMSLDKASDAFKLDEAKLQKSRHYPFKTLTFGEVSVSNPAILLVTDKESGVMGHRSDDLHMIIGMGVLRRLHLYISYKEKQIYVTPATQY